MLSLPSLTVFPTSPAPQETLHKNISTTKALYRFSIAFPQNSCRPLLAMHPVQGTSESSLWFSLGKQSWENSGEQEMLSQVSFLQCAGKAVLEMTYSNCAEYVCSRKVNK